MYKHDFLGVHNSCSWDL